MDVGVAALPEVVDEYPVAAAVVEDGRVLREPGAFEPTQQVAQGAAREHIKATLVERIVAIEVGEVHRIDVVDARAARTFPKVVRVAGEALGVAATGAKFARGGGGAVVAADPAFEFGAHGETGSWAMARPIASATRRALAAMVRLGLMPALDGKNEASTT